VGNLKEFAGKIPVVAFQDIADVYGPIYRLSMPRGYTVLVVSNYELASEILLQKRFQKELFDVFRRLRLVIHDGLASAETHEENWGIARRTLSSAFGPVAVANMFPEMHDIACQLVLRWARFGPDMRIDAVSDFGRSTLDTIALYVASSSSLDWYWTCLTGNAP
jgi:cytochrome P450/NADPH-cytochrome P450 reductase